MIQAKNYTIRFLHKERLTKDTYTFYFLRPAKFEFIPGQYNRWTLPVSATDGRGSSRFFTISSSPLVKGTITITTKIIKSDFKKALMQLKANDEIKIFGPMGNFVLHEIETSPKVFIADGISITPYYSMLHYAAEKKIKTPLTLIVSFSSMDEMIFYYELKKLEEKNNKIKIIYTVTRSEKSPQWNGEKGRVSKEMINKYISHTDTVLFYVVGTAQMEEEITTLLKDMQIKEENIITEEFTGY